MWCMLRTDLLLGLKFLEGGWHILRHANVHITIAIIPFDSKTTIIFTAHIDADLVVEA